MTGRRYSESTLEEEMRVAARKTFNLKTVKW